MIDFRLLGSVEVWDDERLLDVGRPKQRAILAMLVLEPHRAVSIERLVDRVWSDESPVHARKSLYSYLSKLRKALSASDVEIITGDGGYVAEVDENTVDVHRFRALVHRARELSDPAERAAALDEATGMWRGDALADLELDGLEPLRTALNRERHDARIDRVDAYLELGEHAAVLHELQERAHNLPFDERTHGQLLLALYRSGRQAEALRHYETLRERLAGELGTVPTAALRQVHQDILTERAEWSPGPEQTANHGVCRLPAAPPGFEGREAELTELGSRRDDPIRVITGAGGIGKTWLALRWASSRHDDFPDGRLYLDLRGFDPSSPPLDPADALRTLLDAMEIDRARLPNDLAALEATYRSTVAGRRMLILLDNARDTAQITPLLPGGADCLTIITSRSELAALSTSHGARQLRLGVLDEESARRTLLGRSRPTGHDDESVNRLLEHCGGFPLALGILASRAATAGRAPMRALAAELRDESAPLDSLSDREVGVSLRAVFATSRRALSAEAGLLFDLLGASPVPRIPLRAAASLAGWSASRTRVVMRELENAHLVERFAPGHYRMHDLVRRYATELAATIDDDVAAPAIARYIDHYLHTALAGDNALPETRAPVAIAPPHPGCATESIEDENAAMAWFAANSEPLLAVQALAERHGHDDRVWQLAWAVNPYLRNVRLDQLRTQLWTAACRAGRRLDQPHVLSYGHQQLGQVHSDSGRHDDSEPEMRRSVEFAELTDDLHLQSRAHYGVGLMHERRGRFAEAIPHLERSLQLLRASGESANEVITVNGLGWLYANVDDYDTAKAYLDEALELARRHDEAINTGDIQSSLAFLARRQGDPDGAEARYRAALASYRRFDMIGSQVISLRGLARVYREAGRDEDYRATLDEAAGLYRRMGRPELAERLEGGTWD